MFQLFLSFYIIICSPSGGLTQGSNMNKKGYDGISWSFAFLRMPLTSFGKTQGKFWFKQKVWLPGDAPAYSAIGETCRTCTTWESVNAYSRQLHRNSVFREHLKCYIERGARERHPHILHLSILLTHKLHYPLRLHIQNTSSKIKFLAIVNGGSRALNQEQSPSEHTALCKCVGHTFIKEVLGTRLCQLFPSCFLQHNPQTGTTVIQYTVGYAKDHGEKI